MTEKRFTIESERINNTYSIHIYKDDEVIFEISNWDSLSSMHKKECENIVDLLNEQHETIARLEKENEQLKKELDKLKVVNEMLSMDFSNSEHELLRENEQLKKELKRCKNWINSDKNDYELTLAFIKNKGYSLKDVLEYEKELKSE